MPFVFREVQGDLFTTTDNFALAHCVSRDMHMSKGIARLFRDKFRRIEELKSQNSYVGDCAYLNVDGRYIFYLVTKDKYYYKPTIKTFETSVRQMRNLCIKNNVHYLAMPRIGCGLDKLDWNQVSQLIQNIFKDDDIEINVYSL